MYGQNSYINLQNDASSRPEVVSSNPSHGMKARFSQLNILAPSAPQNVGLPL